MFIQYTEDTDLVSDYGTAGGSRIGGNDDAAIIQAADDGGSRGGGLG